MSNADRRAELQAARAADLAALLDELLPLRGDERVLDVGAGTGAFAYAVAPRVREVVAVERDEQLAARARADAPPNVEVVVGDGEHLVLEPFSFDVCGCLRALHHTPRGVGSERDGVFVGARDRHADHPEAVLVLRGGHRGVVEPATAGQ